MGTNESVVNSSSLKNKSFNILLKNNLGAIYWRLRTFKDLYDKQTNEQQGKYKNELENSGEEQIIVFLRTEWVFFLIAKL